jgi:preprotein translocase subunit SecA
MFNEMIMKISDEIAFNLLKVEVRMKTPEEIEAERQAALAQKAALSEAPAKAPATPVEETKVETAAPNAPVAEDKAPETSTTEAAIKAKENLEEKGE